MIISIKGLLRGPRHFNFEFDSDWWRDRDANGQILGLDGPLNVQMTISKEESRSTFHCRSNFCAVRGAMGCVPDAEQT